MLVSCSKPGCNVQFAQNVHTCPVCGATNENVVTDDVDHDLARAESRRRILIGVVSGLCVLGYAVSTLQNLASGVWIILPFSAILLYVWFRVFKTTVDDAPPDSLD